MSQTTTPAGEQSFLDRYFGLTAAGTNARTEFIAGVTTFLTMVYIVFVNPGILGEGCLELGATIREDPLQRPSGPPVERHHDLPQERRGGCGRELGQYHGHPVGAGCIAGGGLPDLADALVCRPARRAFNRLGGVT